MPRTLSSASLLCVLLLGCSQLPLATNGDSCMALFEQLLAAVLARDLPQIRIVLTAYAQRSCDLVVSALTVA